jgi:hypothetical protein
MPDCRSSPMSAFFARWSYGYPLLAICLLVPFPLGEMCILGEAVTVQQLCIKVEK